LRAKEKSFALLAGRNKQLVSGLMEALRCDTEKVSDSRSGRVKTDVLARARIEMDKEVLSMRFVLGLSSALNLEMGLGNK